MKEKIVYTNDVDEETGDGDQQIQAYKEALECNERLLEKAYDYAYEFVDTYIDDLLDNG